MTQVKDNDDLMKRLAGVWRRGRRFTSLRAGCHLVLCALALLAALFLLDWTLDLSGTQRLLLAAFAALVLAGLGYGAWLRKLRPYQPVTCALEVERAYPQFGGLLLSYVQFHDQGIVHEGASPSLVAAMLHQAEDRSRSLPIHNIVNFDLLWKLYLAVSISLLVGISTVAVHPDFARTFMLRMLNPLSEQNYPTRTIIVETSGDLLIQHGQSAHLRVVVSGQLPDEVILRLDHRGEALDTIRIGPGEPAERATRVFSHEIKQAYRDFDYSFLAGDAVSPRHRVRVVRAPDEGIQPLVTFPPYIEMPPRKHDSLSFEAPAGSKISWSVATNRAMSAGRILLDDGKSAEISLAADKRSGTVDLTPKDSFSYGFGWTDESGLVFAPEVRHSVRITADQTPTIVMASAAAGEKATIWKVVDLTFTARDDFGLASARLVYSVARANADPRGGKETIEEILVFPSRHLETSESLNWRVKDSIPDLAPGDVLTYAVEVLDRQPPPAGPGLGRSQTYTIPIVSQEEYLKFAIEKRRGLLARIKTIRDEEIEADKAIQSLLENSAVEQN